MTPAVVRLADACAALERLTCWLETHAPAGDSVECRAMVTNLERRIARLAERLQPVE